MGMYPGYDPDPPVGGGDANLRELQRMSRRGANPAPSSYAHPGLFQQFQGYKFNTTPAGQLKKIGGTLPLRGSQYPGGIPSTAKFTSR